MAWYNPLSWFQKATEEPLEGEAPRPITLEHFQNAPEAEAPPPLPPLPPLGVLVEVFLDHGFGRITPAYDEGATPFTPCLFLPGASLLEVKAGLLGKSFAWHALPASYRANLELGSQRLVEPWAEVQQFLKA